MPDDNPSLGPTRFYVNQWDDRERYVRLGVGTVENSMKVFLHPVPNGSVYPQVGSAQEFIDGISYGDYLADAHCPTCPCTVIPIDVAAAADLKLHSVATSTRKAAFYPATAESNLKLRATSASLTRLKTNSTVRLAWRAAATLKSSRWLHAGQAALKLGTSTEVNYRPAFRAYTSTAALRLSSESTSSSWRAYASTAALSLHSVALAVNRPSSYTTEAIIPLASAVETFISLRPAEYLHDTSVDLRLNADATTDVTFSATPIPGPQYADVALSLDISATSVNRPAHLDYFSDVSLSLQSASLNVSHDTIATTAVSEWPIGGECF